MPMSSVSAGKHLGTAETACTEKVGIMRQVLDEHIHQQHNGQPDAQSRQPFGPNGLGPPVPPRQRPGKPGSHSHSDTLIHEFISSAARSTQNVLGPSLCKPQLAI